MRRRLSLIALVLFVVTACSRHGALDDGSTPEALWSTNEARALAVTQWNLYARGALSLEGEAYNLGIRWRREADDRFMMLLEAPFGQGVLRVNADGDGVYRLRLPDGREFENTSAEALLEDVVGWSLPISGLDYWVRGLRDPRSDSSYLLYPEGRLRSIRQSGWDIRYLDYFDEAADEPLPRRFSLSNDDLTLKLVIEHWQPPAVTASDTELFPSFD